MFVAAKTVTKEVIKAVTLSKFRLSFLIPHKLTSFLHKLDFIVEKYDYDHDCPCFFVADLAIKSVRVPIMRS